MVFLLCGYALYCARLRDSTISGIFLALGFCVKPTTALAAVLIVLLYGRIKSVLAFLGASSLIVGCTAIAMSHIGPLWKTDYQNNLRLFFGRNGPNNFATHNLARFDMVNLQVPIYSVFHDIRAANLLAWAISAALAIVWLLLFLRGRTCKPDTYWIGVGSMSLLALLPVYQRNYNAGVILFVVLWAFDNLHEPLARAVLLLWNLFAMSQLTWAVVAVLVLCFLYKWKRNTLGAAAQWTQSSLSPSGLRPG
jgi:hypothetical protein